MENSSAHSQPTQL